MLNSPVFRWERSFSRSVVRLAVPIMVQSLVVALMHVVDNVMIGQLGETALAGVSQANRVSFLFQLSIFGVVSGASVFTAQFWGNRDLKSIRHVLGLGMLLAMIIAAVFAVPAILIPETVLSILIKDPAAQAMGAQYLRIVGVGYFVQALSLLYGSVMKSTEKVRLPMTASIVAISLNTGLNYLLIFGKLFFPKLGAEGAAIATLIGSVVELLILLIVGYKKNYATAARPKELRIPGLDFVKKYLRVVIPVLLNESFWSLGVVLYSVAYGRMGDGSSVVAAISIYNNVEQIASVVLRGITNASAVMIGMCIGSGDNKNATLYAKRFLFGSAMVGLFAGILVLVIADPVLSIYRGSMNESTLNVAKTLMMYYASFLWMKSMCTQVIVGMLRPGGDVVFSMLLDVLPVWLLGVPLVFFTGVYLGWPLEVVYPLTLIEEAAKTAIGLYRMKTGKWIHNLVQ